MQVNMCTCGCPDKRDKIVIRIERQRLMYKDIFAFIHPYIHSYKKQASSLYHIARLVGPKKGRRFF